MDSQNPLENIMGVEEAAKRWGLESSTVKKMCQRGQLPSVRIGLVWILRKDQDRPPVAARRRKEVMTNETE